jgi:hypothetical protein
VTFAEPSANISNVKQQALIFLSSTKGNILLDILKAPTTPESIALVLSQKLLHRGGRCFGCTTSIIKLQMIEKRQMPVIKRASLRPLRGAAGDQVHLCDGQAFTPS